METSVGPQTIVDRIMALEKERRDTLASEWHALTNGNPGALIAGIELHKSQEMSLEELLPLLRALGLVDSAFYILHKVFGGKDTTRTAEILRTLQMDPEARYPLVRGGALHPVVEYCLAEMRRYV